MRASIGIIGGSGLYDMDGLEEVQEVYLNTPFGAPSDHYILGTLEGHNVAFLARHGRLLFRCIRMRNRFLWP